MALDDLLSPLHLYLPPLFLIESHRRWPRWASEGGRRDRVVPWPRVAAHVLALTLVHMLHVQHPLVLLVPRLLVGDLRAPRVNLALRLVQALQDDVHVLLSRRRPYLG